MLTQKSVLKSLFQVLAIFCFCSVFLLNLQPCSADFIKTSCISGNCNLSLSVEDKDTIKDYSRENETINLQLDARDVDVDANFSKTFKLIAYEQVNGLNNVLSVTNVLFPKQRFKEKTLKTGIKVRPFQGNKQVYVGLHSSAGQLLATFRLNITGSGFFIAKNNLNKNASINFSCPDATITDCNIQRLFFNKVFFETNRDQKAKDTYVVKNTDNTYTVEVPLVSSLGRRQIKNVVKNGALNTGGSPVPNSTLNNFVEVLNVEVVNLLESGERAILDMDEANSQLEIGFDSNFPVISLDNTGNIGIINDDPQARLDIKTTTGLAPLNLASQALASPLVNGSFEFDGTELYFTLNEIRYFVVRDPLTATITPALPPAPPAFVATIPDTDKLAGQPASFYTNATNLNSGLLDAARLPTNLGAFRLRNVIPNQSLFLQGADNVIFRSQADSNITLPNKNGTLLTLAEINLGVGTVTTAKVVNGTILPEDITNNSITGLDVLGVDASKFTTGLFSNAVLPNYEISEVNNLLTELNNRISKTADIVNNLTSTNTDKALSANQGRVMKELINNYALNYSSVNQSLGSNDLSFDAFHSVFFKTLTSNANFTASNLKQGHRVILLMNGNFIPSFPATFKFIQGAYDPSKSNILEFEVASNTPGSERVFVKVLSI
jgi:hypothetical protein